jgi:thiol-disulfide isomerase/thioredoxin
MNQRLLLTVGLLLLSVAAYFVARGFHLRVVNRRLAKTVRNAAPGLAAFKPGRPAVLYSTSPNCAPCQTIIKPALDRLASDMGKGFQVLEVDAERQPEAVRYWNVLSVPTVFVLDPSGKPQHVHYGAVGPEVLRAQLWDYLKPPRQK